MRTWIDVVDPRAGFPKYEDDITRNNLASLREWHQDVVHLKHYPPNVEGGAAGTHADFEWWFLDDTGGLGVRFQAKRLFIDSASYASLTIPQAENLVAASAADAGDDVASRFPMYLFYNGWAEEDLPFPWACEFLPSGARRALGCAIVPAYAIVELDDSTFATVGALSHPWSCLTWLAGDLEVTFREAAATWLRGRFPGDGQLPGSVGPNDVPEYLRDALDPQHASDRGAPVSDVLVVDQRSTSAAFPEDAPRRLD